MTGRWIAFAALGLLLVVVAGGSLLVGKGLAPGPSLDALLAGSGPSSAQIIVWKVRTPRVLLGLVVGAGLAGAGCVLQGMLRNPLADPFTLGVSGGAALGATAVQILVAGPALWFLRQGSAGSIWFSPSIWILPGAAFIGALGSSALVYLAAGRARFSPSALILAGVALSFFFSSVVYLFLAIARPDQAQGALLWLMGDLASKNPALLKVIAPPVGLALAGLWVLSRDLDALTLGDEKARSLGVPPERTRKILFALASLATGASVAAAGIVGFVGLMVPHCLRPFVGPDHRVLLPASLLGGAALLAGADTLARSAFPSQDLPVGVITGLLGGLFLLALLLRGRGFRFF